MAEARFAPAREQVAAWQYALGRASDEARALPDPFLSRRFARALHRIAGELGRVEDADDVDAALLDALERARRALGEARALLARNRTGGGPVDRTIGVLVAIDKALGEARLPTADAATLSAPAAAHVVPPFRASRGVPQLFTIERDTVLPAHAHGTVRDDEIDPAQAWRVFPPVDAPELAATVVRMPLRPIELAARQQQRLLEVALAEIGAVGGLRGAEDAEIWHEGLVRFESRLLAALDAAVATGRRTRFAVATGSGCALVATEVDIARSLIHWSDDALPGDCRRAFCRALVLGCLRGADAARAAASALDAPNEPERSAIIDALALASSAHVDDAVREACRDPRLAPAALEVARRRGSTDVATAMTVLAAADSTAASAAARALGAAPDRELARDALVYALAAGLEPEVEQAACESALRLGIGDAIILVRERASGLPVDDPRLDGWLRLLALSSDRGDAQVLRERAGTELARLQAWGYAGMPELAAALVERIEASPRGATPRAMLDVLERISGIVAPEPFDPAALRAAWRAKERALEPGERHCRGRRSTLAVALQELGSFGRYQHERRFTSLEVAFRTGGAVRIDPDDWVARQQALVARALEAVT
jgi:hypothetical protein